MTSCIEWSLEVIIYTALQCFYKQGNVVLYSYFSLLMITVRNIIVFFAIAVVFTTANAQSPYFKNYTVNDGLASSDVYECRQDSKGYIWISTETGVSRYDGQKFESFTLHNGLADDEIFGTREDSKSRIWFISFNGKLSYYLGGQIFNANNDSRLRAIQFHYFLRDLYEDSKGFIWISSEKDGVIRLNSDLSIDQRFLREEFNGVLQFYENEEGQVVGVKSSSELRFENGTLVEEKNEPCRPLVYNSTIGQRNETEMRLCHDSLTVDMHKKVRFPQSALPRDIMCALEDQQGRLWVGSKSNGVRVISEQGIQDFLEGINVTHVFQDSERNIWISTMGEGVYFLSVNNFLTYSVSDGLSHHFVQCLARLSTTRLISGTSDGKINVLSTLNGSIRSFSLSESPIEVNHIRQISVAFDQTIWSATDEGLFVSDEQGLSLKVKKEFGACKTIVATSKGDMYLGTSNGAYEFKQAQIDNVNRLWSVRTTAIHQDSAGTLWLGTLGGLYNLKDGKVLKYLPENDFLKRRITSITSKGKTLFLGTYGYGLLIVDDGKVTNLTIEDGLLSNFVRRITLEPDGTLWLSTDRGLGKLLFNEEGVFSKHIGYTNADGLYSVDVEDAIVFGDTVYVATADGLTFFDINHPQSKYLPPRIYITGIRINDLDTLLQDNYELNYQQDNLHIDFTGISFESVGDIKYKYRLLGLNEKWEETKNSNVIYPALAPGNYKFEVIAIAKNGVESDFSASFSIHVNPHFINAVWFRWLVVAFFLSLISYLVWQRIRQIKRKAIVQRRLLEFEHKALMTQMNPHFIFNTMSSIQQFINLNDKKSANRYLARFAELMRRILHNSRQHHISLEQEIETLRLYLEFEALRFDNKFSYRIEVDSGLEPAMVEIPTMFIQPYVENAILHGLSALPKGQQGHLNLSFGTNDTHLLVEVIDNGVGREKAQEVKLRRTVKHESTAMKNIEERIKLLNSNNDFLYAVHVEDLYLENGKACGTRVNLKIPLDQ